MPPHELHVLAHRGCPLLFPRYSTIIREGNRGAFFYLVLQGQVRVTSEAKGLDILMGEGASFGEASLLSAQRSLRREATVSAFEACYVLQYKQDDISGLQVDLGSLRSALIAQMLLSVPFFKSLRRPQREALGAIFDLVYRHTGERLFEEGDPGDKMYVVAEGAVSMHKRSEADPTVLHKLASYSASSERPWFGEMSMWTKQPRAASCTCDEPTKLLVVHANDFNSFLEVYPDFATMFSTAASSFAKINSVRAEQEQQRATHRTLYGGRAEMDERRRRVISAFERLVAIALREWRLRSAEGGPSQQDPVASLAASASAWVASGAPARPSGRDETAEALGRRRGQRHSLDAQRRESTIRAIGTPRRSVQERDART